MANNEKEKADQPAPEMTQESIIRELDTSERYKSYFGQFLPGSVKDFINSYAQNKAMWWQYGPFNISMNEREDMQWINAAANHLEIIQQKKLFDAQCLWRAEKVTYPGIELCFDFKVWEQNVLHCPFLEPVKQDDIALYIQYLQQDNIDFQLGWLEEWQDYEEIKEAFETDNASRNVPEWYEFHNSRTGTGVYLSLPDIRGEKENFYVDITRAHAAVQNKERNEAWEANRDKRPYLSTIDKEQLEHFINTFEDKQTQEYYKAYKRSSRNSEEEEVLMEMVSLLLSAEEPVAIGAHYDFREALVKATERFKARKIAEYLPFAYNEYLLNQSMNLGAPKEKLQAADDYSSIRKTWYGNIIKGRILNGEPGDLNF
ncbi:hypothetical protein ACTHGU_00625 [Chitinophagaceae bacterium MMS25-I14]